MMMNIQSWIAVSVGLNVLLLLVIFFMVSAVLRQRWKYQILQQKENELNRLLLMEKELYEVNQYREITNNIYNNILEADITQNKLLGENCQQLIKQLSLPPEATFTQCIEKIIEKFIKEEFHDIYRDSFGVERLLERYENGEKMFTFEFVEKADLVNYMWTRVTVCIYYSEVSGTVKIISYVKNIQEEKEMELALQQKATTDPLTGLLNREGILNHAEAVLAEENSSVAMFMIDVDWFKEVNDELGHQYGDQVLMELGACLKEIFGQDDAIGRIGGDEFMVIHHYEGDTKEILQKAEAICKAFARTYSNDVVSLPISSSVGIALFPMHGETFKELYKNADVALYTSKENGKNQCTLFQKKTG